VPKCTREVIEYIQVAAPKARKRPQIACKAPDRIRVIARECFLSRCAYTSRSLLSSGGDVRWYYRGVGPQQVMRVFSKIIVVPRWSGRSSSDWYPWLSSALEGELAVEALDLPEPGAPTIEAWTAGVAAALGDDAATLESTLLVGHSVGARAALHALERLPAGRQIGGLLAVAGWWTVDRPWPTIVPWIEAPLDLARVRAATRRIEVLLSDNDPFTADDRANAARWQAALGARVTVCAGALHFNGAAEPAVLAAIRRISAG